GAEDGPSTALVYAIARSARPASSADWSVVGDVEQAARPAQECNGACGATDELPNGTGLMPQLRFIDDHPVVAYYDSIHRAMKAVMGTGSGATPGFRAPVEIDGDDGSQRDTGRWP